MEIFVFSDRQVSSMAEWQEAINKQGFPLRLSTKRPFAELGGHLPAQLDGEDIWFECDHFDAAELMAHYAEVDFGHAWKFVLAFRIGASLKAPLGAWIAATAYARATGGFVFDEIDGKLYTPEEGIEVCRVLDRDIPQLELQLKELRERPPGRLAPSPVTITVKLWKGKGDDGSA